MPLNTGDILTYNGTNWVNQGSLGLSSGNSFYNLTVGATTGFRVDEATTNLATNPSVEVDATNWAAPFGAFNTGARDTTRAYVGVASWKANRVAASGDTRITRYTHSPTLATGTYTTSAWVYVQDAAIGTVSFSMETVSGAATVLSSADSGGVIGSWVRLGISFTVSSAGSFNFVFNGGANQQGSVFIDAFQIEQKAGATTYADGSLGNGYTWSGAAHASTASRAAGLLTADGNISVTGQGNCLCAGLATAIASKSAAYTLTAADGVITADATGAAFTVTLPTAVGIAGRQYTIKKTDSSAHAVTVGTTASQTIDGAATYSLSAQYQFVTVASNGTNWVIVAK